MSDQSAWTAQVDWMRANGVTLATWEDNNLIHCELGPKPTAGGVMQERTAKVETSPLSILRQGSRLRLRTPPKPGGTESPHGSGT
jgi:hypothetical protein